MTRYPESQYVSVKKILEKYNGQEVWNKDDIVERTEDLADILYYNIIEG